MKTHVLTNNLKQFVYEECLFNAYYSANVNYYNFIHNSSYKQKLIVYQMGKVGSTTVWNSLQSLKNVDVYHVHALTQHGLKSVKNYYKKNFHRKRVIPDHLLESQYLRKQLDKGLGSNNKWKIVTLVRDPIAKNISSFFQKLDPLLAYDYKEKTRNTERKDIIKDLSDLFINKFDRHEKPLNWFNSEIKSVFNIDVFSSNFPKTQGYEIYQADHADLLIVKLEQLNECASEAFNNLLGISEFALLESNISGKKTYGNIYRMFLESIILPDSYIEQMYASNYVRHFYSEEEIEAFKAKWRR